MFVEADTDVSDTVPLGVLCATANSKASFADRFNLLQNITGKALLQKEGARLKCFLKENKGK